MTLRNKPEYLYIHVPFCASICSYCDFAHTVYGIERADQWLAAIEKELIRKDLRHDLKTVYLGGGTPTSLNEDQLERLLCLIDPYTSDILEYTCEVNPETMSAKKAKLLADHGVNRVSIGYQCFQPELLKLLNRHHTAEDVKDTIALLRSYGIDNISLDLMYSLPSQTMEMLKESIDHALDLNPSHLSLYSLTIEENTVFGKTGVKALDEDLEADMYEYICGCLPAKGYMQYEISNFAKCGFESLHNRAYWTYRDFIGIGCGASGKEGFRRYDHTRSLSQYLKDPLAVSEIPLSKEDAMFEMVMMNLRLREGMSLRLFEETYGISFYEAFQGKYEPLMKQGLLYEKNGMLACEEKSWHLLNSILEELI